MIGKCHVCTFCLVYFEQTRSGNTIFYLEFQLSLNNSITLATCFICKMLSYVISLSQVGYVSYFNKLLGPVQAVFKFLFGLLKVLLLHNLSECALLIYRAIYLTKGILIMFPSVTYHLQEYLCEILLTIKEYLCNQDIHIYFC